MVKKIVATAVLGAALTFGAAGVAGASTATGTHPKCAKAPAALARIAKLEAKGNTYLTKAAGRETAATANGHLRVAARIERRIKRVQRLEAKGTKLENKIEAACPGAVASSTGS